MRFLVTLCGVAAVLYLIHRAEAASSTRVPVHVVRSRPPFWGPGPRDTLH